MDSLPPAFIKNVMLLTVAMVVAVSFLFSALFAGLSYFLERRRATRNEVNILPNPLLVENVKDLATKAELKEEEAERRKQDGILHKRVTDGRAATDQKFDSISRALGRIEGAIQKRNE